MAVTVLERPFVVSGPNTSKAVAAGNPIIYKFIRKDYPTLTVANNAGKIRITFADPGALISQFFAVGSVQYFESDNGVYALPVTVAAKAINTPVVGQCTMDFNEAYTSAATTGWINAIVFRSNWYLEVTIANTGTGERITIKGTSNAKGRVVVDISSCKNQIELRNELDNSPPAVGVDQYAQVKVQVGHKEVFTGSTGAPFNITGITFDTPNIVQVIGGSRQLRSPFGSNMLDYTTFGAPSLVQAKWLTTFTRPKMWRGMPFALCFIVAENYGSTGFYATVQYYDKQGTLIIGQNSATITTPFGSVFYAYPSLIEPVPDDAAYFRLSVYESDTNLELTFPIICDIVDKCDPLYYISWRNSLGGISWWGFEQSQDVTLKLKDIKNKRVKLYAEYITENEFDAINELNTIGEVYDVSYEQLTASMYRLQGKVGQSVYSWPTNGAPMTEKIGVVVVNSEDSYKTRRLKHSTEVVIDLPEIITL